MEKQDGPLVPRERKKMPPVLPKTRLEKGVTTNHYRLSTTEAQREESKGLVVGVVIQGDTSCLRGLEVGACEGWKMSKRNF